MELYTHTHTHTLALDRIKIKSPSEALRVILSKITKSDVFAILIVFIIGLINNFMFIITDGVAPDALSPADFNIAGNWEISLGRFGIKFVNMLRFGLVNKFIIILISLLFIAISVIVIMRIFEIKNRISIFFVAAIIAVAPQFTETYMFLYCADAYCLAFLLSTLTVLFLKRAEIRTWYYILACISTILVCSLYQAYLGVIIGLTIMLLLYHLLNNMNIKEFIIKAIIHILVVFAGVVLYYIILKMIISALGISLASYKGANSLGINTIINLPKTILQTYKDFFSFFFTNKIINNSYYNRNKINIILFVSAFIGTLFVTVKNKYNNKSIKFILLSVLVLVFPIGINIMNLIAPGTTINLVTGPGLITTIILLILIYKKLDDNFIENALKYIYILSLIILIFTFILQNTFTYMARQSSYKNYYTIANDIYSKATELEDYSNDKKWLFSDVIRFRVRDLNRTNGFISGDNVTWNNYGGTLQNSSYFEKYLGIKIKTCTLEEYKVITETEEFKQMPIYPNLGSIKIINNIVVIKVSNKTF